MFVVKKLPNVALALDLSSNHWFRIYDGSVSKLALSYTNNETCERKYLFLLMTLLIHTHDNPLKRSKTIISRPFGIVGGSDGVF